MTHPNREELAGLLEQRAERLVIRPGELATYCPLDADLDRKAAAALRQSPTVEEVARVIDEGAFAGEGDLTWTARRGRRTKALAKAQAIDTLYKRGGG